MTTQGLAANGLLAPSKTLEERIINKRAAILKIESELKALEEPIRIAIEEWRMEPDRALIAHLKVRFGEHLSREELIKKTQLERSKMSDQELTGIRYYPPKEMAVIAEGRSKIAEANKKRENLLADRAQKTEQLTVLRLDLQRLENRLDEKRKKTAEQGLIERDKAAIVKTNLYMRGP